MQSLRQLRQRWRYSVYQGTPIFINWLTPKGAINENTPPKKARAWQLGRWILMSILLGAIYSIL